jgi:hypothetical protein
VTEPQYTDFRPKWAREQMAVYASLSDTPHTGTEPDTAPRLPIRIVPSNEHNRLTAATLVDVIATSQRIVTFASCEAAFGINPDFADLRTADARQTMNVEPVED